MNRLQSWAWFLGICVVVPIAYLFACLAFPLIIAAQYLTRKKP